MVGPEIYVDVNVFIYWLGGHHLFGETSYKWVKEIYFNPYHIPTSYNNCWFNG